MKEFLILEYIFKKIKNIPLIVIAKFGWPNLGFEWETTTTTTKKLLRMEIISLIKTRTHKRKAAQKDSLRLASDSGTMTHRRCIQWIVYENIIIYRTICIINILFICLRAALNEFRWYSQIAVRQTFKIEWF